MASDRFLSKMNALAAQFGYSRAVPFRKLAARHRTSVEALVCKCFLPLVLESFSGP